jgi:hypothetical protein
MMRRVCDESLLLTRSNRGIEGGEYRSVSFLYFRREAACVLLGDRALTLLGHGIFPFGREGCLLSRVLQMFSAVEFGINRPHSRSDHRHGSSQDSHYDCEKRMPRGRKEDPESDGGNGDSCEGCPQAEKEKQCRDTRDQIWKTGCQSSRRQQVHERTIEKNRARQYALKQETCARPAFGECGKETLQTCTPVPMLNVFGTRSKGLKGGFWRPTSGVLLVQ